ncbi:MAG: IMPACT family protein [Flavobacteriales bacterium]
MAKYRTIETGTEGFYKEKGSKFLAFAVPVSTEQEVKNFIAQKRKEHHQAVHVCSAFRLGADFKTYRSSDDGEPSNSAGPPILGQIQAFELTNILIAVVRYYGGTNLGVGGLITAYRTAAKEAIEAAQIIEKEEEIELAIEFPYEQMHLVMDFLKREKAQILHHNLAEKCQLNFRIAKSESEKIRGLLISIIGE